MTVAELIRELETFPDDLHVIVAVRPDDPTRQDRMEGDADAVFTSWALVPGDVVVVEGQH